MGKEYRRAIDVLGIIPAKGSILFRDDFTEGIKFAQVANTSDPVAQISQAKRLSSKATAHVITRLTGAAASDYAGFSYNIPPTPAQLFTLNVNFLLTSVTSASYVEIILTHYTGTYEDDAKIKVDIANSKLQYYNDAGAYADVTGGSFAIDPSVWHAIAIETDIKNVEYRKLYFNNKIYDLSGTGMYQDADTEDNPQLVIAVNLVAADGNRPQIYFDNIVLSETNQ